MHRPLVSASWFRSAPYTGEGTASPSLRRVVRSWRRPSFLQTGITTAPRSAVMFVHLFLDTLTNAGDVPQCHAYRDTSAVFSDQRSCLYMTRRGSCLSGGLRGLHVGASTAFTGASSFACSRRWASTGRRPTYQEISEALSTLNVSITDEPGEIKKKYRDLVKKNHPDAGGDEATMSRITVSYDRLVGLSKREKEEFQLQKKMYGGGSGGGANPYQARAAYTGRRGASPFGYAYGSTGGSAENDPHRGAGATGASGHYYQGADPFADARAQQQSYWNYYNRQQGARGTNFTENPFSSSNPFSLHNQMRRARFMPSGTLLVQGFIGYLFVTLVLLFAYRAYRDHRHEDGWRMSESLARHEQLQELHRLRQEMNERARQMQQDQDPDGFNRPLRVNETAESRALEYARQRRIKAIQEQRHQQQVQSGELPELRGWPKLTEEQGRIIKRAQDPPGIVFFEPTREDSRLRQIKNQRRTDSSVSSWKARSQSNAEAERAAKGATGSAGGGAAAMPYSMPPRVSDAPVSHGTDPSHPLPAESNVGAVFATQVNNNADTREALNTILGLVRKASHEQEAERK